MNDVLFERVCSKCGCKQNVTLAAVGRSVRCTRCRELGRETLLLIMETSLTCPHCQQHLLSTNEAGVDQLHCVDCDIDYHVSLRRVAGTQQTSASPVELQTNPPEKDAAENREKVQAELRFLKRLGNSKPLSCDAKPRKENRKSVARYCPKCSRQMKTREFVCYRCDPKGL